MMGLASVGRLQLDDDSLSREDIAQAMMRLCRFKHKEEDLVHCSKRPKTFCHWDGIGDTRENLSWIYFGYDLEKEDYVYGFPNNCYDISFGGQDPGKILEKADKIAAEFAAAVDRLKAVTFPIIDKLLLILQCGHFPACPMLAHHYMLGGTFRLDDNGWCIPEYRRPIDFLKPAMDFMAAMKVVIQELKEIKQPAPLPDLPQLRDTAGENMRTLERAFPLIQRMEDFNVDLNFFWKDSIILNDTVWFVDEVKGFTDQQLFSTPGRPGMWYAAYVNPYMEYMLVFTRGRGDSLEVWKIEGQLEAAAPERDGHNNSNTQKKRRVDPRSSQEFVAHAKLRAHTGQNVYGDWTLTFLKEIWILDSSCLICEPTSSFPGESWPLILDLTAPRVDRPPRALQMIRLAGLPKSLEDVVALPGRRRKVWGGVWEPIGQHREAMHWPAWEAMPSV